MNDNNDVNEGENTDKMSTIDDKQLSPPRIPVDGISDIESVKYDNDDKEPVKNSIGNINIHVTLKKNIQWKTIQ